MSQQMKSSGIAVLVLVLAVTSLIIGTGCPAGDQPDSQDGKSGAEGLRSTLYHYHLAEAAVNNADYPTAHEHLAAALGFTPYHPSFLFRMARVEALLNDPEASLARLQQLADIGATVNPAEEEAFAEVCQLEAFAAVAERLAANGHQQPAADVVVTLAEADLWSEGIAYDPVAGDLYIGSMTKKKIVRLRDGRVEEFGSSASDGLMGLLGMQVDTTRRRLWACTGDGSDELVTTGERRRNAVVTYDLETEQLVAVLPLADDGKNRLLNDLAIAPDGTVYVTESNQGALYQIVPGEGALRLYRDYPNLNYLNGIAISPDGKLIWVAAVEGIQVIDLASGEARPLQHDHGVTTVSGDGLQVIGNSLIAVQNRRDLAFRVVRLYLTADGRQVEGLEVMPAGMPDGLIPYTCAVGDGVVYVNGTSTLDLLDRGETPPNPVVVSIPL